MLLIFDFSSQPYSKQSIIPFMKAHIEKSQLQQVVPDVTIRYNHSVIRAKADPYRFVEFLFRKSAHLFMYFMLGLLAHLLLVPWIRTLMLRVPGALLIAAAIASLDEWNQSFTGGPDADAARRDGGYKRGRDRANRPASRDRDLSAPQAVAVKNSPTLIAHSDSQLTSIPPALPGRDHFYFPRARNLYNSLIACNFL
ncbi:VanZ family protein [Cohnella rhizosphaerae]|uniref:VanZ family protein n=1 Tax=Cohnella rhizosphaerae TaxID=1457232 RepID=A0A9X4KWW6_9BACL|nr:VanZ family protein [Cohnella rhizosphaerae]MDG0811846.1 VanZ family protein [Cohnella rhizosphaerae]